MHSPLVNSSCCAAAAGLLASGPVRAAIKGNAQRRLRRCVYAYGMVLESTPTAASMLLIIIQVIMRLDVARHSRGNVRFVAIKVYTPP